MGCIVIGCEDLWPRQFFILDRGDFRSLAGGRRLLRNSIKPRPANARCFAVTNNTLELGESPVHQGVMLNKSCAL